MAETTLYNSLNKLPRRRQLIINAWNALDPKVLEYIKSRDDFEEAYYDVIDWDGCIGAHHFDFDYTKFKELVVHNPKLKGLMCVCDYDHIYTIPKLLRLRNEQWSRPSHSHRIREGSYVFFTRHGNRRFETFAKKSPNIGKSIKRYIWDNYGVRNCSFFNWDVVTHFAYIDLDDPICL